MRGTLLSLALLFAGCVAPATSTAPRLESPAFDLDLVKAEIGYLIT